MIDISDGLGADLRHLAQAGLRVVVDAGKLPGSAGFRRLCSAVGESFEEAVFHGGEDYELLFSLPMLCLPPRYFIYSSVTRPILPF